MTKATNGMGKLTTRVKAVSGIRFVRREDTISSRNSGVPHGTYLFLEEFPDLDFNDKIILNLYLESGRIMGLYEVVHKNLLRDGRGEEIPTYLLEVIRQAKKEEINEFPLSMFSVPGISPKTRYYVCDLE